MAVIKLLVSGVFVGMVAGAIMAMWISAVVGALVFLTKFFGAFIALLSVVVIVGGVFGAIIAIAAVNQEKQRALEQ